MLIDLVSVRSQDVFVSCPVRTDRCSFFKIVLYFLLPAFSLPLCTNFSDIVAFTLKLNSFVGNRFNAVLPADVIRDFLNALILGYRAVILLPIFRIARIRVKYNMIV